jgi:dTDP-4-amino-4,6-dideoxygalactose transaminase
MLRAHGSRRKYYNERVGYNSRLDALQAALLRVKLPRVDAWNEARRQVASRYNELLAGLPGLVLPEVSPGHVFHQYTVRVLGGRDRVAEALAREGVGTMVYYPVPLHRLPVYAHMGVALPEAERAAREVLSLPIGPHLNPSSQEGVSEALKAFLKEVF